MGYYQINCIHNDQGRWCKNKQVKRSLLGLGARMCRIFERKECECQERHPRPQAPPAPPGRKGAGVEPSQPWPRHEEVLICQSCLLAKYVHGLHQMDCIITKVLCTDRSTEIARKGCAYCKSMADYIILLPCENAGVVPDKPSPPPPAPQWRFDDPPDGIHAWITDGESVWYGVRYENNSFPEKWHNGSDWIDYHHNIIAWIEIKKPEPPTIKATTPEGLRAALLNMYRGPRGDGNVGSGLRLKYTLPMSWMERLIEALIGPWPGRRYE